MKRLIPLLAAARVVSAALSAQDIPTIFQLVSFTDADQSIQFLPPAGSNVTPIDEHTPWTYVRTPTKRWIAP